MPMVRTMSSSHHIMRPLIFTCIIAAAAFSAQAQVGSDGTQPPTVSRVCLWNADQSTWKSLGLKRSQIARMQELREQYPAVVDGQWVVDEVEMSPAPIAEERIDVDPNLSTSISGPAAGAAKIEKKADASTAGTAVRPTGLQHQLRAVLTPTQLKRWVAECGF